LKPFVDDERRLTRFIHGRPEIAVTLIDPGSKRVIVNNSQNDAGTINFTSACNSNRVEKKRATPVKLATLSVAM
jgi:hypothetical protein